MEKKYLQAAGTFECVVVKPDAGWIAESKEKGTPFIRIPVMVVEGPHKGELALYSGWLSEKAFDNTIQTLANVFGFNGNLPDLHLKRITFENMPCNISTEIENYNNKSRCKVKWLNPPGGGEIKKMDETKVANLLAQLTQRGKAIAADALKAKKSGKPVVTAPPDSGPPSPSEQPLQRSLPEPSAEPEDDDVPF